MGKANLSFFAKLINVFIRSHKFKFIYIDNKIIHLEQKAYHKLPLKRVLRKIPIENNLKIRSRLKCNFCKSRSLRPLYSIKGHWNFSW